MTGQTKLPTIKEYEPVISGYTKIWTTWRALMGMSGGCLTSDGSYSPFPTIEKNKKIQNVDTKIWTATGHREDARIRPKDPVLCHEILRQ